MKDKKNSDYYGVSLNGVHAYAAKIGVNKKYIRLGNFNNQLDAALAYDAYVRANNLNRRLNFPDPEPENLIPNTRLIRLTMGKFALVDEEDFESLNKYDWHIECNGKNQYATRNAVINGRRTVVKMHCDIMGEKGIDHKDHDGINNRKINLRKCTHQENMRNRASSGTHSSKYKGVSIPEDGGKYVSKIGNNNSQIYLGTFDTDEEAAVAYNVMATKLFGEFASLNILEKQAPQPTQ